MQTKTEIKQEIDIASFNTLTKWDSYIFLIEYSVVKNENKIFGETGSAVEFDGLYLTACGVSYCIFLICERDRNDKNRHFQLCIPAFAESIADCAPTMLQRVSNKACLYADGCGFGKSNVIKENFFKIWQCCHYKKTYVIGCDTIISNHFKIHDNLGENRFKLERAVIRSHSGILYGSNKLANLQKIQKHCYKMDYNNNYNDGTKEDAAIMLLQHCYQHFACV